MTHPPFDWLNWRFRENDPELARFNSQAGLTKLGEFAPGQAPTIFNSLITLDPVPQATFCHEMTHRELTRATTFGLFFEVIYFLSHLPRFRESARICYQHQWQIQEACATYTGLALVADIRPDYLAEAVLRLPSGKLNQPPYREAFETLSELAPIRAGTAKSRLQGQQIFATAIGHCSMNNDCLVRFADPESLDETALEEYLVQSSPNRRFQTILNGLRGRIELDSIIDRAH